MHRSLGSNHAKSLSSNEPFTRANLTPKAIIQSKVFSLRHKDIEKKETVESLKDYFQDLLSYPFYMVVRYYYQYYYRAQVTTESNISRLINPPSTCVRHLGRCNDIGESMFYCSNCYVTSILELKPKLNDIITILIMEVDENFNESTTLPLVPLAKNKMNEDLMGAFILSGNQSTNQKLNIIYNLLEEVMLQEVNDGEEWKYKSSIGLSKAIIENFENSCGIAFPSKASKHYGVNFALPPYLFNKLSGVKQKSFRVKIIEHNGIFDSVGLVTEIAQEKDTDGNFLFKNVEHFNRVINLNKKFYDDNEKIFKAHKATLKKDSFYRKNFAPPDFPFPFNLVDQSKILHINPDNPIFPQGMNYEYPIGLAEMFSSEKGRMPI